MNLIFPLENDKSWRTALVQDQQILLINKRYDTAEDFLKSYEEKGLFKQKAVIEIPAITTMEHPEKTGLQLTITAGKKQMLQFASQSDMDTVSAYIAKARNLKDSVMAVSKFKAISPSLFGLVLTALFTFIIYEDALIIESGGEVNTSGRRSLYRQLFAWLGGQLGSTGTLVAGTLAASACIYFIVKGLKNPPNKVVYR